jgi:chromosome segregation ATPase
MAKTLDRIFEATAASRELEALIASTAETGGDITELETKIDELAQKAETLPQAIDDLLSLVSEIEYRASARKTEGKRLTDRAKQDEKVAEWFKGQVLRILRSRGTAKLETARFKATVAQPGGKPAMEILDEVPDEWTIAVTEIVPDKERIREALEKGEVLSFARLIPKEPYLRIS